MNSRNINFVWGAALVIAGMLFLAQNFGLITNPPPIFWISVLFGISLVFFISYFVSGVHQWWWLLPAMGTAGVAVTLILTQAGVRNSVVGSPILLGIGLPFMAAFLVDRRQNWWALIPAWVLAVLAVVTAVAEVVPGEVIGSVVLFAISLPFWVVFLTDRSRWWALIPGGIMLVIGFIPLLTLIASGEIIGTLIMFLFAIPFLVVAITWPKGWWALIPAGIFATIGVVTLLATNPDIEAQGGVIVGVLFLGWALTFFVLWLRRAIAPTGWARYPAFALLIAGLAAFAIGTSGMNFLWPLMIIGIGAVLLYNALVKKNI